MNTRIVHTPEHPLPRIERPTFAPERALPVVDQSAIPTAVLPRPDPVDAAVAALRGVNNAIDNASRAMEPLTPDQQDEATARVEPHPAILAAEAEALADGRTDGHRDALRIARKHLACYGSTSYAHGPLAALVAELEAL